MGNKKTIEQELAEIIEKEMSNLLPFIRPPMNPKYWKGKNKVVAYLILKKFVVYKRKKKV